MKSRSETGFADLKSLVSDVEPALREAERRTRSSKAQASPAPSSSDGGTAQRPTAESQRRVAPQKSVRWGRVVTAVAGVGFIVLLNQDSEPRSPSPSGYYTGTPATEPAPGAAAPSTSNSRTPSLGHLTFAGHATNRGYPAAPAGPTSARITLTVSESDLTTGYLLIDPPLGGAGTASFRRWGDSVLFFSVSESGDTIAWLGRAVRGRFSGSYRVIGGQWRGQWGDWFFEQIGGSPVGTLPPTNRPFPDSVDIASRIGLTSNVRTSVPDGLYERRPIAGGDDRVLDLPEIRFCLAEEIRIRSAEAVLDVMSEWQIDRYNQHVDSYNHLCGSYRYRSGALETARREVERHRARLVREGRARMARSSGGRTATPPGDYAASKRLTNPAPSAVTVTTARARRSSDPENLATCLSGEYPILCRHELLSEDQLGRTREAERSANYRTCASGDYPSLCKHHLLTAEQLVRVQAAERAANYRTCASGDYPSLCKHHLLTTEQLAEVRDAERAANYRTCASGDYPSLCKHHLLTPRQLEEVRAAERRANLQTCLSGLYASLCKRTLLSPEEIARVDAVQRRSRRP